MSIPACRKAALATLAVIALLFTACATQITIAEVPADLSPAQLFQRAQDCLNRDEFDNARVYVKAFKERFPEEKVKDLEADYLLAQLLVKENKPAEALEAFKALSARYQEAEAGSYPQWVKILADKLVAKLEKQLTPPSPAAAPVASPAATAAPQATAQPADTPAPATAAPASEATPVPAATAAPTEAPAASPAPEATPAS